MKYSYIYLFLIVIILFFSFKNSSTPIKKEAFHPYIRQWYRPIVRNTRIYSNSWYNKINESINIFLRKTLLLK